MHITSQYDVCGVAIPYNEADTGLSEKIESPACGEVYAYTISKIT